MAITRWFSCLLFDKARLGFQSRRLMNSCRKKEKITIHFRSNLIEATRKTIYVERDRATLLPTLVTSLQLRKEMHNATRKDLSTPSQTKIERSFDWRWTEQAFSLSISSDFLSPLFLINRASISGATSLFTDTTVGFFFFSRRIQWV